MIMNLKNATVWGLKLTQGSLLFALGADFWYPRAQFRLRPRSRRPQPAQIPQSKINFHFFHQNIWQFYLELWNQIHRALFQTKKLNKNFKKYLKS